MKRFDAISLTMVLAVAGALNGCDRRDEDSWDSGGRPARVCVDAQGRRVPENDCAQPRAGGVSPFLWYYLATRGGRGLGGRVPPYGEPVAGGSFRPSAGVSYVTPPAGGVSRGGFGGTARSFGGLGGEGAGE